MTSGGTPMGDVHSLGTGGIKNQFNVLSLCLAIAKQKAHTIEKLTEQERVKTVCCDL